MGSCWGRKNDIEGKSKIEKLQFSTLILFMFSLASQSAKLNINAIVLLSQKLVYLWPLLLSKMELTELMINTKRTEAKIQRFRSCSLTYLIKFILIQKRVY